MKILIALVFVVLSAESIASAAPINNSTEIPTEVQLVQKVETPTEVVQPTLMREVPTPEEPTPVEPEQVPEAPQVPTVTHPIGCEEYRQLISQYEWNVDVALNVMHAESGCNPYAVGDNRVIGGIYAPSCGLFQIRTLPDRPSCEQLQNPATNIEWAIKLYGESKGWKPWSVCNIGKVSCY